MSNSYFNFKQFSINQDRSGMKVGTDGVLLGAWVDCRNAEMILDIGTGTGLIALMLAQRCNAHIDAIEIDADSFMQADENVRRSRFADRISVAQISLQEFSRTTRHRYDLIVANPPYFTGSLKSHGAGRTAARHDDTLPRDQLIDSAHTLLKEGGRFALILPHNDAEIFADKARDKGLFCLQMVSVSPTPGKQPSRMLIELGKTGKETVRSSLVIGGEKPGSYSESFMMLTRDFYL
jgi:tRNA1Val (adenine37-N6)-methyltransferase